MNPADSDFAAEQTKMTALDRYGQGDEVAGMVSYLASSEAAYEARAKVCQFILYTR
ncbi:hypothetical protein HW132_15200 [Brasilonema sp. CT11]|nr:hypothetical protein [Brasilonema sp. CT11]